MPFNDIKLRQLYVGVWNYENFQENDFMGNVVIDLSTVDLSVDSSKWYLLKSGALWFIIFHFHALNALFNFLLYFLCLFLSCPRFEIYSFSGMFKIFCSFKHPMFSCYFCLDLLQIFVIYFFFVRVLRVCCMNVVANVVCCLYTQCTVLSIYDFNWSIFWSYDSLFISFPLYLLMKTPAVATYLYFSNFFPFYFTQTFNFATYFNIISLYLLRYLNVCRLVDERIE